MSSQSYPEGLPDSHVADWLRSLSGSNGGFSILLDEAARDSSSGFHHTIREICQQPATWSDTASRMKDQAGSLREWVAPCNRVILTGSGSSQYAGECVAPALRRDL